MNLPRRVVTPTTTEIHTGPVCINVVDARDSGWTDVDIDCMAAAVRVMVNQLRRREPARAAEPGSSDQCPLPPIEKGHTRAFAVSEGRLAVFTDEVNQVVYVVIMHNNGGMIHPPQIVSCDHKGALFLSSALVRAVGATS